MGANSGFKVDALTLRRVTWSDTAERRAEIRQGLVTLFAGLSVPLPG